MGQPISVSAVPGREPGVMLFELNRSLTGMEIERYRAGTPVTGERPPDVLARRLFELGVTSVTVYSSSVTVEAPPTHWTELQPKVEEVLRTLFRHYGPEATEPDMVTDGAG
jgi:hypothetical protein